MTEPTLNESATSNTLSDDLCPTTGQVDCDYCSGAACNYCGAGCWSGRRDCDHDSAERHYGLEDVVT